jgi:hypothetical protein
MPAVADIPLPSDGSPRALPTPGAGVYPADTLATQRFLLAIELDYYVKRRGDSALMSGIGGFSRKFYPAIYQ